MYNEVPGKDTLVIALHSGSLYFENRLLKGYGHSEVCIQAFRLALAEWFQKYVTTGSIYALKSGIQVHGMVSYMVTPSIKIIDTHLYTSVERATESTALPENILQ